MADKIKSTVRHKGRAYTPGMEAELAAVAEPELIKSLRDRQLISGKFSKPEAAEKSTDGNAVGGTAAVSDSTPPGVGDAQVAAEKAAAKAKANASAKTAKTGAEANTGETA